MGMRCPNCNSPYSRVTNTYREVQATFIGKTIVFIPRRRQCIHCSRVFHTREFVEDDLEDDEHKS